MQNAPAVKNRNTLCLEDSGHECYAIKKLKFNRIKQIKVE